MKSAKLAPDTNPVQEQDHCQCPKHIVVETSHDCSIVPTDTLHIHLLHTKTATATTTKSKLSLCFAFLLATTCSLLFAQLLFHAGPYIAGPYSPLVCRQDSKLSESDVSSLAVERQHGQFFSGDGSRMRFPKTKRRLPQCIIIGARKCGTRALIEFLNLHPMIQKATEEVHFFDDDAKYALGLDWYRRRMPYSFAGQITVEKSPAYFVTPSVPERIRRMDPNTKLLLIVRDPVTRLISDYAQLASNKARKDRTVPSFAELVLSHDGTNINTGYKAVRISIYAMFLRRWLNAFPRDQIHIVDGDRLVYDPLSEVRNIEHFLGLAYKVEPNNFYYNETKGFFCVRNATMQEKCLNESKGRKHPEVSPDLLSLLRRFYEPYNNIFYKMTGLNFSWPTH